MTSVSTRQGDNQPQGVIEWTVRNFKALEHASLPLLPLNVLLGPNSSGKSSLIQSLLLLGQSIEDEIILNGPLVRLGDPSDVVRAGCDSVTFGFVARGQRMRDVESSDVLFEVSLTSKSGSLVVSEFIAVGQVDSSVLVHATSERVPQIARDNLTEPRSQQSVLRVRTIDDRQAPAHTFLVFNGLIPASIAFRRSREDVLNVLKRSLEPEISSFELYIQLLQWLNENLDQAPTGFEEIVDTRSTGQILDFFLELPKSQMRTLLKAYVEANFAEMEWVNGLGPGLINRDGRVIARDGLRTPPRRLRLLDPLRDSAASTVLFGASTLRIFQGNIRYLGPLREEPQVVSPTGARYRALPSGAKGEYTADLFARSKEAEVDYFDWNGRARKEPLKVALTRWVAHLGLGDDVTVEDQGKLGRGLRIKVNGAERDLTTIGVGASQLLPVLTVVLTAEPGNVILLEQPELHLHPSVQSRLADFFLYAKPQVKVVVESHSEYLVTRLRRRVVENPALLEGIAVLFAEQHRGITEIRQLRMDRLGDFSDWPAGFFDTQDNESTELARAVRKAIDADIAH